MNKTKHVASIKNKSKSALKNKEKFLFNGNGYLILDGVQLLFFLIKCFLNYSVSLNFTTSTVRIFGLRSCELS